MTALNIRSPLLLLFVLACDTPPTAVAQAECVGSPAQQVLELMNEVRNGAGLPDLMVETRIVTAAEGHSRDMADHDLFGHAGSDGSNAAERVRNAGYDWVFVAENVAAGQVDAETVFQAWMGSPGHRANILAPDARHVGIGYVVQPGSEYGHYWTVNFGATLKAPVMPADGCHP